MKIRSKRILSLVLCAVLAFSLLPTPSLAADDFTTQLAAFPESYRAALTALHEKYPNWQFIAENTGLDFTASVTGELRGNASLISTTNAGSAYMDKSEGNFDPATGAYIPKDSTTWVKTTPAAVSYFLDPRNFLNETYVFQFLDLGFNAQWQTVQGIEHILKGTFMSETPVSYLDAEGTLVETEETYADLIWEAGETSGVNPYYLASKIRQEMGANGSGSCSGDYAGIKGIYNFFNIGASSSADPVITGLTYASQTGAWGRPWTSPRLSILGGAAYVAAQYIGKGQNTGYYIRFNVAPDAAYSSYTHQYMTNISGATQESITTRSAYAANGLLDEALAFIIPVYEGLPTSGSQVTLSTQSGTYTVSGSAPVNVRSGPGVSFSSLGYTIAPGETVTVLGTYRAQAAANGSGLINLLRYPLWHQIRFTRNGATITGYVCTEYFAPTEGTSLEVGGTLQLSAAASDTVWYESENYQVATVSGSGLITGVAPGSTVIRAVSAGGGMSALKVTVTAPVWKNPYSDVAEGQWYYDNVAFVTQQGLFQGSGGKFDPNGEMTRAMFVTVLYRMAGKPAVTGSPTTADAASIPDWARDAVVWASAKGIVLGYDDNTFRPNTSITRQQLAVFLHRYAVSQGFAAGTGSADLGKFSDASSIASWAKDAMNWAVSYGLISGSGGLLRPEDNATRCQVAKVIHMFFAAYS